MKNETLNKVIDFITIQSIEEDFKLDLQDSYMAKWRGKDYSSGYFTTNDFDKKIKKPTLVVGTKRPIKEWVGVLLHEYCHFTQYRDKAKVWKDYMKTQSNHKTTVDLELDCEKRTISLIKKLGIEKDFPVDQYAKNANAYITFYHIYNKTNRWYDIAPFSQKKILKNMPDKILPYTKLKPSKELFDLYVKLCYKK